MANIINPIKAFTPIVCKNTRTKKLFIYRMPCESEVGELRENGKIKLRFEIVRVATIGDLVEYSEFNNYREEYKGFTLDTSQQDNLFITSASVKKNSFGGLTQVEIVFRASSILSSEITSIDKIKTKIDNHINSL